MLGRLEWRNYSNNGKDSFSSGDMSSEQKLHLAVPTFVDTC